MPIQHRIFKSLHTNIDLEIANTYITAQRNLVNDGKSRKASLSKSNALTFEQLNKLESTIES